MTPRWVTIAAVCSLLPGSAAAQQPSGRAVALLLDRGHLSDVAERARRGDAALKGPIAALEEDARKALAFGPVSVMDKGVTPPGGDKHAYMSQAPYWWPDPAKPGGRPYIRRDGERNPEISRITDHENFDRVMAAVSTLGLAYRLTGRDEYATHAATLLRVWFLDPATRMMPHLEYGQGIPGINEGRGIGIIETRALVDMLDGVLSIAGSGAWKTRDENGLHAWMTAYLRWLTESSHGKEEAKNGNNHETWYDVQVAGLALFTGQESLARRTLEGARTRIARQIEPDGRQPRELERTRSWDYSIFNLRAFFDLSTLGERVGVDLWNYQTPDGRSLRKALDYLVPSASGERPWTHAQITPFRPHELTPLLRRAAAAWKAPAYRELALKLGGGSPRLDLTTARHQRHEFTPAHFHNTFAATSASVLRVSPGDTIHTTTIDAAGTDDKGVRRAEAGNPQTGPFYIEGAEPGDTVAVHLTRLRLNRAWAIGTDTLSNLAMTTELAARMSRQGHFVRWRLDIERGIATRENPSPNLAQYAVPLKPMLGSIALAPAPAAGPAPHTGEFGAWGGNLDFNEIVEGTTVFLPVSVPGGLLYFGDAHAAQGDGELGGAGLETSMDVEIRVELLRQDRIPAPRVESSTHLMTMGLGASLDDAVRTATTNMVEWLMARHDLTFSEVSQVLGTSAEYRVSVIVGRNAGMVLKVHKDRLRSLKSSG